MDERDRIILHATHQPCPCCQIGQDRPWPDGDGAYTL
jgi:hypothetical protein